MAKSNDSDPFDLTRGGEDAEVTDLRSRKRINPRQAIEPRFVDPARRTHALLAENVAVPAQRPPIDPPNQVDIATPLQPGSPAPVVADDIEPATAPVPPASPDGWSDQPPSAEAPPVVTNNASTADAIDAPHNATAELGLSGDPASTEDDTAWRGNGVPIEPPTWRTPRTSLTERPRNPRNPRYRAAGVIGLLGIAAAAIVVLVVTLAASGPKSANAPLGHAKGVAQVPGESPHFTDTRSSTGTQGASIGKIVSSTAALARRQARAAAGRRHARALARQRARERAIKARRAKAARLARQRAAAAAAAAASAQTYTAPAATTNTAPAYSAPAAPTPSSGGGSSGGAGQGSSSSGGGSKVCYLGQFGC
jgi:hypothetical protein